MIWLALYLIVGLAFCASVIASESYRQSDLYRDFGKAKRLGCILAILLFYPLFIIAAFISMA